VSSSTLSSNPGTSDVNWPSNSGPVANFTLTDPPLNTDINVYNYTAGGTVNLAIDAFAYFLPAGASPTPTPTPSANNATVTVIPTDGYTVPADASTTDALTTTVYGAGTAPVKLDPIEYTLVPSVAGTFGGPATVPNLTTLSSSCGTLSSPPVVESPDPADAGANWWFGDTGGAPVNGQIMPTYTPSTVPGTCTITATEADFNQSATIVLTQTPTTFSISVAANPTDVVANGGGAGGDTTVTATVTNIIGGPAVGDSVIFTSVPNPAGACGAMPASPVITGSNGTASFTYTSTGKPGFCTITAEETFNGSEATTTIVQTKPASLATQVSIQPAATTLPADGTSHANFNNAVIYAGSSSPVLGDPLMTVESPPGCGTAFVVGFPPATNPTFGVTGTGPVPPAGTNVETFTAGTTPGPCTITTTEAFNGNQTSVVINLTPKQNFLVLSATPDALTGNGVAVSEVSATVFGPTGAVVSSDLVTLTILSPQGDSCGTFPTGDTWHGLSDSAGVVEVPFTTSDILPTTSGSWCIILGSEATTGGAGAPITIDQEYV
jgi:hypothetical protein